MRRTFIPLLIFALLLADNPITDYSPVSEYYDNLEEKDFELNKEE